MIVKIDTVKIKSDWRIAYRKDGDSGSSLWSDNVSIFHPLRKKYFS